MGLVDADGWIGALPIGGDRPRPADLAALIRRPAWMADGLCREPAYADVSFFPERGQSSAEAKAICARCTVAVECLQFAQEDRDTRENGIWGGTSPGDRQRARSVSSRKAS